MDDPLPLRLLRVRREVLGPRFAAAAAGHDFGGEEFAVELKDFFALGCARSSLHPERAQSCIVFAACKVRGA